MMTQLDSKNNNKQKRMPPKPWQTKATQPRQDVSAVIQNNPTIKQQIPKLTMEPLVSSPSTSKIQPGSTLNNGVTGVGTASTTGALGGVGSTYGGYGSSYGGYGSSYGGLGSGYSSYGGMGSYGGYGSMYGGYGGMSRYGMMGGMGGMGSQGGQRGFIMNTLITLQSFGYLITSLCDIARSLDHNYEGLHLFYNSFKNLCKKMQNGFINGFSWIGQKIKGFFLAIFNFIKFNVLCMNQNNPKSKMKALKIAINTLIILLMISLYPILRKALKKV